MSRFPARPNAVCVRQFLYGKKENLLSIARKKIPATCKDNQTKQIFAPRLERNLRWSIKPSSDVEGPFVMLTSRESLGWILRRSCGVRENRSPSDR